jgi:hypothetical protein
MTIRAAAAAAILLLSGAAEAAADGIAFDPSGLYVGAGVAVGGAKLRPLGGDGSFTTGVGANIWLGYRIAPWLAFELQGEYVDHINRGDVELAALTGTANFRLYWNHGRFHPFALAGAGIGNWATNLQGRGAMDTSFAARFGGGLEFDLGSRVSLVAMGSYVVMYSNLDGYDYGSGTFGAQYRF